MRYRTLATAVVVALSVVACTGGQDPTVGGTPAETTLPTEQTVAGSTPAEAPEPDVERIEVTVSDGEVHGPGTVDLEAGTQVELVVTSDVDDHVHVHGYDLFEDVTAAESATLTFTADIPGAFEVELEDRALRLVELRVRG